MEAPGRWVDEGPRTPYSPTVRFTGSMALPVSGKPASIRIPTNAEQERQRRSHDAYNERQRRSRRLTQRQIEVLAAVEQAGGNRSHAAKALGITQASVYAALVLVQQRRVAIPPIVGRGPDLRPRRRAA